MKYKKLIIAFGALFLFLAFLVYRINLEGIEFVTLYLFVAFALLIVAALAFFVFKYFKK